MKIGGAEQVFLVVHFRKSVKIKYGGAFSS